MTWITIAISVMVLFALATLAVMGIIGDEEPCDFCGSRSMDQGYCTEQVDGKTYLSCRKPRCIEALKNKKKKERK